ncbi:MAG TPA: STAS domain-containing protein [Bryobacteraceae bacterium]|nr:STAS domain-containing protein [Bryobacteraceae bacterium]
MQIRRNVTESLVEMRVVGRLDGYWAPQLATELDDVIREGHSRIRLNLSGLEYLSSAGIQILVRYYQELNKRQGSLDVARPSDPVRKVLGLSGLDLLLARVDTAAPVVSGSRAFEVTGTQIEACVSRSGASQQCRVRQPDTNRPYGSLTCWKDTLAIGFGAFTVSGAAEQFGPFLAVAGAAVCLPTDGRGTPDFMLSSGSFVPDLTVKTSLVSEGLFAGRADFSGAPANFATLASAAMEMLETDLAALAVVAVNDSDRPVLAVGVAAKKSSSLLGSMMLPLTVEQWPAGVFSGCVFAQPRELKREQNLETAVGALFHEGTPERLLTINAICRMRFPSGSFFASPITNVMAETGI